VDLGVPEFRTDGGKGRMAYNGKMKRRGETEGSKGGASSRRGRRGLQNSGSCHENRRT